MNRLSNVNLSSLLTILFPFVLIAHLLFYFLAYKNNASFLLSLTLAIFLSLVIIRTYKHVANPFFFSALISLIAFYLPYLYLNLDSPSISLDLSLLIFFAGYLSFCFPLFFRMNYTSNNVIFSLTQRKIFFHFLIILLLLIIFYNLRIKYQIGLPNVSSSLPFSGVIYYFSTTFVITYIIFIGLMSQSRVAFFIFFLACGSYAFYQAFLGWRSGINEVLIVFSAVYFYKTNGKIYFRNLKFFFYILLFVIVTYYVITIQNDVRLSNKGFFDIWVRLWGIQYLDSVIGYFFDMSSNILTNDFFGLFLFENNLSTSEFHNKFIIGDSFDKQHGNARTGFGSIFMIGGLLSVIVIFFLLGFLYRAIFIRRENFFFALLSISLLALLQRFFIEQFDFGAIKNLIAIFFSVLFFHSFLRPHSS